MGFNCAGNKLVAYIFSLLSAHAQLQKWGRPGAEATAASFVPSWWGQLGSGGRHLQYIHVASRQHCQVHSLRQATIQWVNVHAYILCMCMLTVHSLGTCHTHKNSLVDLGCELWMVMEYHHHGSLLDYLLTNTLTSSQVRLLLYYRHYQLQLSLSCVQAQGFVHSIANGLHHLHVDIQAGRYMYTSGWFCTKVIISCIIIHLFRLPD